MANFRFFKMATVRHIHIEFLKFEILTVSTVWRASMTHHAKFRANRSNHCRDMTVYSTFKMVAVRLLGFLKVAARTLLRANMHYPAKFHALR